MTFKFQKRVQVREKQFLLEKKDSTNWHFCSFKEQMFFFNVCDVERNKKNFKKKEKLCPPPTDTHKSF